MSVLGITSREKQQRQRRRVTKSLIMWLSFYAMLFKRWEGGGGGCHGQSALQMGKEGHKAGWLEELTS